MFQVIEKVQTENIKAFEPKSKAVREYYNHTHELMKRLAWSSRKLAVPSGRTVQLLMIHFKLVVHGSRMARYMDLSQPYIQVHDCTGLKCSEMCDGRIMISITGQKTGSSSWETVSVRLNAIPMVILSGILMTLSSRYEDFNFN
jgi:hypothetical protein